MPYLEQRAPLVIILGAFFCLSVPLALLHVVPNFLGFFPSVFLLYVVGLGTTHFFVTLAVYLQAQNREHFRSSTRNRLIYFAAPPAILGLYALSAATDFRARHVELAAAVFSSLRFFDFFHVGRQSAGVLRLFERPRREALPAWLPRAENAFFVGMALLQWETFLLGGRFGADRVSARIPAIMLAVIALAIIASHARSWLASRALSTHATSHAWLPLLYFALQAASAAAAVWQTRLYLSALAMHYVEYHVMMRPRCFETPLDTRHALDRAAAFVRERRGLFYGLLLAVAVGFELRSYAPADLSPSTTFCVHVFDGIFLVHYFLEAFLWKFSDPFYRRTLGPLYLEPHPRPSRAAPRPWPQAAPWLALALLSALVLAAFQGWLASAVRSVDQLALAPLGAENHLRWGIDFARRGELASARRHLDLAERLHQGDPRTTAARLWLQRQLASQGSSEP
ncbi:MAG: hypothetical protein ACHQ53_09430 [Polyangiales bacterium]